VLRIRGGHHDRSRHGNRHRRGLRDRSCDRRGPPRRRLEAHPCRSRTRPTRYRRARLEARPADATKCVIMDVANEARRAFLRDRRRAVPLGVPRRDRRRGSIPAGRQEGAFCPRAIFSTSMAASPRPDIIRPQSSLQSASWHEMTGFSYKYLE
jgi:hypothetical protein